MISRLALVIHWFSFLFGILVFFTILSVADFISFSLIISVFPIILLCNFAGWLIRFILVGKVSFFPFTINDL